MRRTYRRTQPRRTNNDDLKGMWATVWRQVTGRFVDESGWVTEYRFHQTRRWLFDWAHRPTRVAVEIDGGNTMAAVSDDGQHAIAIGGHTQEKDYHKLNAAAADGWRVFRFTPRMLTRDPIGCVQLVAGVMGIALPPETKGW